MTHKVKEMLRSLLQLLEPFGFNRISRQTVPLAYLADGEKFLKASHFANLTDDLKEWFPRVDLYFASSKKITELIYAIHYLPRGRG